MSKKQTSRSFRLQKENRNIIKISNREVYKNKLQGINAYLSTIKNVNRSL